MSDFRAAELGGDQLLPFSAAPSQECARQPREERPGGSRRYVSNDTARGCPVGQTVPHRGQRTAALTRTRVGGCGARQEKPSVFHPAHPGAHQAGLQHQPRSCHPSGTSVLNSERPRKRFAMLCLLALFLRSLWKPHAEDPKGEFSWERPPKTYPRWGARLSSVPLQPRGFTPRRGSRFKAVAHFLLEFRLITCSAWGSRPQAPAS